MTDGCLHASHGPYLLGSESASILECLQTICIVLQIEAAAALCHHMAQTAVTSLVWSEAAADGLHLQAGNVDPLPVVAACGLSKMAAAYDS